MLFFSILLTKVILIDRKNGYFHQFLGFNTLPRAYLYFSLGLGSFSYRIYTLIQVLF